MTRPPAGAVIAFALRCVVAAAPASDPPKELPSPPKGFDQKRDEIARGKVEAVEYATSTS